MSARYMPRYHLYEYVAFSSANLRDAKSWKFRARVGIHTYRLVKGTGDTLCARIRDLNRSLTASAAFVCSGPINHLVVHVFSNR